MASVTHDVIQELKTRARLGVSRPHVGGYYSAVTKLGTEGWKDLGAQNPGANRYDFPKEVFNTETGSPATVKSRDITMWGASSSGELYDYTSLALQEIIGTSLNSTFVTVPAGFQGTIDNTGSSAHVIKIGASPTILTSLSIGDTVAVVMGTVNLAGGTYVETQKVIDIDDTADTITLEGYLSDAPPAGALVYEIDEEDTYIGGNTLQDKKFRTLTSLTNGDMVVIFFDKGNFVDPPNPNFQNGRSAATLAYNFNAIGVPVTVGSTRQVIVGEHTILRSTYF